MVENPVVELPNIFGTDERRSRAIRLDDELNLRREASKQPEIRNIKNL